jgi:hypothetical protein
MPASLPLAAVARSSLPTTAWLDVEPARLTRRFALPAAEPTLLADMRAHLEFGFER